MAIFNSKLLVYQRVILSLCIWFWFLQLGMFFGKMDGKWMGTGFGNVLRIRQPWQHKNCLPGPWLALENHVIFQSKNHPG